jgi:hypothetical protein
MIKSFAELEAQANVSPDELEIILFDYARSGAAIKAAVVNKIIARTNLSSRNKRTLVHCCQLGWNNHLNEPLELIEYVTVMMGLQG